MPQYVPVAGEFTAATLPKQVGSTYHVGIGDGTNAYGYMFQNTGDQKGGLVEKQDITSRSAFMNYGSPNLVDRDLTYFPRVSQGDFSGGALQAVFINPNQFYDSDLEIRTPGYLLLRPAWVRTNLVAATGTYQSVVFNNLVYTAFGQALVYASDGSTITPGINAKLLDTDGNRLYLADGVNSLVSWPGSGVTFATISSTIGAIKQMWVINLGSAQRSIYYTTDNQTLLRVDLTTNLSNIAVATGSTPFTIKDICPYQSGIAVLTIDSTGGGSTDVWYHDGQNLTRIVHLSQYLGVGLCNALGSLFVTATSTGNYEAPAVIRIDAGAETVVVRPGSPLALQTAATIGYPVSSGQYVYFALGSPQVNGITTVPYIGVYDQVNGTYSHLGAMDALDAPQVAQPRQLATSGRAVAFPMTNAGSASIQSQTNSSLLPAGNVFTGSGWLVSSNFDFSTPAIEKRFRTIEVHHAPLAAGEQVVIRAFVDQDPTAFTTALVATATATNTTVGTNTTTLSFGANVGVGHMMYFAVQLTAGTGGTTSPKVHYSSIEVGGTWLWELALDCTVRRRVLQQGGDDPQGVTGKDLYFLIRNAYENGTLLTLYLAQTVTYTVTIETMEASNPAYFDKPNDAGGPVNADQEWLVSVVLRQVA